MSFIFCLHFDCTNCLVLKIKYPFQYINSYCSHEIKHDFPFRLSLNLCNKLFRLVRIYRSSAINRRAGKWKFSSRLPIVAFIQMSRNIICISTEDRSRRLWWKVTYSLTWHWHDRPKKTLPIIYNCNKSLRARSCYSCETTATPARSLQESGAKIARTLGDLTHALFAHRFETRELLCSCRNLNKSLLAIVSVPRLASAPCP